VQLPFEIRIEGQGVNWASSPKLKAIAGYEFEAAPERAAGKTGAAGRKRR
jgi:hypothetical protein